MFLHKRELQKVFGCEHPNVAL